MRTPARGALALLLWISLVGRTDADPRASLRLTMTCEDACHDAAIEAHMSCRVHGDTDPTRARCEDVASASLELCLRFCED